MDLPDEEQAAFLDRACAGDLDLRRAVEGLLQALGQAAHFLEDRSRWTAIPPLPKLLDPDEAVAPDPEHSFDLLRLLEALIRLVAQGMTEAEQVRFVKALLEGLLHET